MDLTAARSVNIDAKRKWIQLGKPNELACGVVVKGAVWWFKAKVGERSSRIDGPFFNLDLPSRPKDASAHAAQLADAELVKVVRTARLQIA